MLDVEAHHGQSRLVGAPVGAPLRLRQLRAADFPAGRDGTVRIDKLREHIATDLAADVARLLGSGATYDGEPIGAGDVALLLSSVKRVEPIRAALRAHGIPSVVGGGSSVMLSSAADEWLTLLEALEQQRTTRVRAVALTSFIGETPQSLDAGGDALADRVGERVRSWLDLFRTRGVAAVHEAATAAGLPGRVLSRPDGERLMTDLDHLGQLLHETARRQRLGLPALLEWLRAERREAFASTERTRRLDTDAAAVQILTIHGSKGLQYPVVYLPHFFDCYVPEPSELLYHDATGARRLDLAGSPDAARRARAEDAGEELRLTYVALTRAQSQVVTWWGPSQNAAHSGLSRLLFGRTQGQATVPDRVPVPTDYEALAALTAWQDAGALALETATAGAAPALDPRPPPAPLDVRRFMRTLDTDWRRTSYSGLIRAEEQLASTAVEVEPEVPGTVDEDSPVVEPVETAEPWVPTSSTTGPASPMADLPAGATFGSLVHGGARARRPAGSRPARRAAPPRRPAAALVVCRRRPRRPGRGAGADAAHAAGVAVRGPAPWPTSRSATGCASSTSSSLWSAATVPAATCPTSSSGRWPTCCAGTSQPTTRCGRTPTGWSRRRWAGSCCGAT